MSYSQNEAFFVSKKWFCLNSYSHFLSWFQIIDAHGGYGGELSLEPLFDIWYFKTQKCNTPWSCYFFNEIYQEIFSLRKLYNWKWESNSETIYVLWFWLWSRKMGGSLFYSSLSVTEMNKMFTILTNAINWVNC